MRDVSRLKIHQLCNKIIKLKDYIKLHENKIDLSNATHLNSSSPLKKIESTSIKGRKEVRSLTNTSMRSGMVELTMIEESSKTKHYIGPLSSLAVLSWASSALNKKVDFGKYRTLFAFLEENSQFSEDLSQKYKFEKILLTPQVTRILLQHYFEHIYPNYPIFERSYFIFDVKIKNLPSKKRLFVLYSLSISSCHLMRSLKQFYPITLMLQQWTSELCKDVLAENSAESFLALIHECIFQLFETNSRSLWHILGLCTRFCLKYGYPRYLSESSEELRDLKKAILILYDIETDVCLSLGRPSMLTAQKFNTEKLSEHEKAIIERSLNRITLFRVLLNSNLKCPFSEDLFNIMREDLKRDFSYLLELWLYIGCHVLHECNSCSSRHKEWFHLISFSLIKYVDKIHTLFTMNEIDCIWLTTTKVFTAGIVFIVVLRFFKTSSRFKIDVKELSKIEYESYNYVVSKYSIEASLEKCKHILKDLSFFWVRGRIYSEVLKDFQDLVN
ncbi:uncharacterized protein PRCAT00005127001 [Priceomyces carsonii]|uniref:uncharacterized protein n=1 Tax=Priceomyces carsonii TaxID=28549 RepID=UPI002EDB7080|nr:unnamed protein product [Priceomyces carsonii]